MKGCFIMINANDNAVINERLRALYEESTNVFLEKWEQAFLEDIRSGKMEPAPCRINDFGIIDINNYDSDNGILFVGRETNRWANKDYECGCLFRDWMREITQEGLPDGEHITQHPNMWYNVGRWTMLLTEPGRPITDIAEAKGEAIKAIGKIAFTNINKVRGKKSSEKEYYQLANDSFVKELLKREIEIISPKIIVACGTARPLFPLPEGFSGKFYIMPHPGARQSKTDMLVNLNKQIRLQRR